RKGYRGSSNDDIWLCDADGSNNRRVTLHPGQDGSPMWAPDGRTLYYVSDVCAAPGGPANIVRQDVTAVPDGAPGVTKPQPLTSHKEDGVRKARMSKSGEWIVYECGPDLWVASTRDGSSRKLTIEAYADDRSNTEKTVTFKDKGVT